MDSQAPILRLDDVLERVHQVGGKLWQRNGQLHYRAPKGALSNQEIEALRLYSPRIVSLLDKTAVAAPCEPRPESVQPLDQAPLTFSQTAHWTVHHLSQRNSLRQIACVMRLRGLLNMEALRRSVGATVRRHDALRTQVVLRGEVPFQEVCRRIDCIVEVEEVPESKVGPTPIGVDRLIEQFIAQPIDVSRAPLFGIKVLRYATHEHLLVLAMDHLISDMASVNVVLQDVFTAYGQILRGHAISLPQVPIQFPDYALWQQRTHPSWLDHHGAHWEAHFAGCGRMRNRLSRSAVASATVGWGSVPLQIGRELKAALSEWCRIRRTTLPMAVFTAYVGLILRWYDVSDTIILFQTDGRQSAELARTVGYLSSALYLRITAHPGDSFADLLNKVTDEYCQAYQHADSGYFAAQSPRPEFTRNTLFNWIPAASGPTSCELEVSDATRDRALIPFANPVLRTLDVDHEPMLLLYESGEVVTGEFLFPRASFQLQAMKDLSQNFLRFLMALLRAPQMPISEISLRL